MSQFSSPSCSPLSYIMNIDDSDNLDFTDDPAMSTSSSEDSEAEELHRNQYIIPAIITAVMQYSLSLYNKQDYHMSALTDLVWVLELLTDHPDHIQCKLGVKHHAFKHLLSKLYNMGYKNSCEVRLEEQLSIFLYTSVTGLSIRHVSERFQQANSTFAKWVVQYSSLIFMLFPSLSRYFKIMLNALSPFYDSQVQLPTTSDPIPPEIHDNPKCYPFFKNALGALDGTHINCSSSQQERQATHNWKGLLTQNCLIAYSFDLCSLYVLSGWEGSAADSLVFHNGRFTSFPIPERKYYLADAGFPSCDQLLVPYQSVRYHLAEWGWANII